MNRFWKWLLIYWFQVWLVICSFIFIWGITWGNLLPPPSINTEHANCTHAAELHDKEMRRHLDKIDEQGQIIGAYEYRSAGLGRPLISD